MDERQLGAHEIKVDRCKLRWAAKLTEEDLVTCHVRRLFDALTDLGARHLLLLPVGMPLAMVRLFVPQLLWRMTTRHSKCCCRGSCLRAAAKLLLDRFTQTRESILTACADGRHREVAAAVDVHHVVATDLVVLVARKGGNGEE